MENHDRVLQLVFAAIDELNQTLDPAERLDCSAQTVLIGGPAAISSLNFVNLLIAIEEKAERILHRAISVTDIVAGLDDGQWTVARLAEFIAEAAEAREAV